MNQKRGWSFIGLLIIALVVSLPFYSANALAVSVQVSKNSGQEGLPKFIDAQGDVWTVEATVTGSPQTVNPADVKIKIGSNEAAFQSCSPTALGTACQYISPLTSGVSEGEYPFQVFYNFLNPLGIPEAVSAGDIVKADGSGPQITFSTLQQNAQGQVEIGFTVKDQPGSAVGIKTIEILDADTNTVLQGITIPEPGTKQWNYDPDSGFGNLLQATLPGEGLKRLKIRAEDFLAHASSQNPVKEFQADFIEPVIKDNLNFTQIGKFIGDTSVITDMTIDLVETELNEVKASSSLAGLDNTPAIACLEDAEEEKLWHCRWTDVEVSPSETIAVTILASDQKGNSAVKTISKQLTKDVSAPTIDFFGTERAFEGKSFIRDGTQRLLLRVNELGAGIDETGIRANLLALGKGTSEAPTACEQSESTLNCYWEFTHSFNTDVVRVGLSKFEDKVGNQGTLPQIELFVDNSGPLVEKLEVFGISEVGEKDYFQSNDQLKMKLAVVELNGLTILLNLNDIVMDAGTQFPESDLTKGLGAGWAAFKEEDVCTREEGKWNCELETSPVKSGPEQNVKLEIRIRDTAGNEAGSWPSLARNAKSFTGHAKGAGDFKFDLLGLSTEENPDFWEVKKVLPLGGESNFIDLDTAPLTFTRMPLEINLKTTGSTVKVIDLNLEGCEPKEVSGEGEKVITAPAISRALLYKGVGADGETNPKPKIIIEFEPFDGRELFGIGKSEELKFTKQEIPYVCRLKIFSIVGQAAIRMAELQEVTVKVPFAFTKRGALDETLDDLIKKEKEGVNTGLWGAIGKAAKILRWLDYGVQTISLVMGGLTAFNLGSAGIDALQVDPLGGKAAVTAACLGMNTVFQGVDKGLTIIDVPVQLLSCRRGTGLGMGWYQNFVNTVLTIYNIEVGKAPDSPLGKVEKDLRPAHSLQDNFYLSMLGLCIPGIVKNLDKLRQIKCRKIYCLQNEVKAGLTTVSGCNELEGLLTCKYFVGELWYLIPFTQLWDKVVNALWQMWKDPLALAHTATIVACGPSCTVSKKLNSACLHLYYLWDVIGYIERIAGFITTVKADIESGGLQYCDSVLGKEAAQSGPAQTEGGAGGGTGGGTSPPQY